MNKFAQKNDFDLSQYTVLQPRQSRICGKHLYVVQNDDLHINKKMMDEIDLNETHYAKVLLHNTENQIMLQLFTENTMCAAYLGTNGYIKLSNVTERLKSRGIKCPACFTIKAHPQENAWIAVYEPNYHFPEYKQSSKRSKRPRKDVNEGMMPGNE